jgi:hypothetical protein
MQHIVIKQVKIGNEIYYEATEVVRELHISRQTLWKWRRQGHIPQGSHCRRKRLVFSQEELPAIIAYAQRVEPVDLSTPTNQLKFSLK